MADSNQLDATLLKLGVAELEATQRDLRATIAPKQRADTAGQRALAILSQLSGGRSPAESGALTLERTLGQGGMGVVHLGTQVALGRKVAVKTLRPEHRSEATAMQLLREAWITGSLEHPNVVPIYDLGLDGDGHPYIILKRIEGVQWAELMHDGEKIRARFGADDRLDWNLQILMQVCNALSFAHSRGILHRDLKPENVMIGEFGEVYVLDWGIAVSLRDDGSGRLPLAGEQQELCGTPSYMAPEMLDGQSARLTERTDVYLLGGMLYELITGHPPHGGETLRQVLAKVLASDPPFPDGIEPELVRICRRALAADPDARFENAQQLRLALQGFLHRRSSSQLAAEAQARFQHLRVELAAPPDAERAQPISRRLRLYNLFGECRFGFQQALRTWRDNQAAHDGLLGATAAMIEYELAEGDPKAAALLAGGLESVPAELRARIEAAERASEAARERSRALERLGSEWDFTVGRQTRVFLAAVSGTIWTTIPLLLPLRGLYDTYFGMMVMPALLLLLMTAFAWWARESMTKTAINRALMGSALFTMIAQIALHAGSALLGMPWRMSQVLDLFLWFSLATMTSINVERRLVFAALAYLAAFFTACLRPSWVFYTMSASNAVLTVNMLYIWSARDRRRAAKDVA